MVVGAPVVGFAVPIVVVPEAEPVVIVIGAAVVAGATLVVGTSVVEQVLGFSL